MTDHEPLGSDWQLYAASPRMVGIERRTPMVQPTPHFTDRKVRVVPLPVRIPLWKRVVDTLVLWSALFLVVLLAAAALIGPHL